MVYVGNDVYFQRFHSREFGILFKTEVDERIKLSKLKVRVVDHEYFVELREGEVCFLLDLYFINLSGKVLREEELFNYNT